MIEIDVTNRHTRQVALAPLEDAVRRILVEYGYAEGEVSIALLDDSAIHELNRRYLQHDYPTDVLSFILADAPPRLEGEILVSVDTAAREADRWESWCLEDELLLYVVHGALHLVGLDDQEPQERSAMQERERYYLTAMGRAHPPERGADSRAEAAGDA